MFLSATIVIDAHAVFQKTTVVFLFFLVVEDGRNGLMMQFAALVQDIQ